MHLDAGAGGPTVMRFHAGKHPLRTNKRLQSPRQGGNFITHAQSKLAIAVVANGPNGRRLCQEKGVAIASRNMRHAFWQQHFSWYLQTRKKRGLNVYSLLSKVHCSSILAAMPHSL